MTIIEFADDAGDAAARGISAFAEFVVDLELTNQGYPHKRVLIVRVDEDGDVVVCETDDDGVPIRNSTWAIPLEVIKKVTVL